MYGVKLTKTEKGTGRIVISQITGKNNQALASQKDEDAMFMGTFVTDNNGILYELLVYMFTPVLVKQYGFEDKEIAEKVKNSIDLSRIRQHDNVECKLEVVELEEEKYNAGIVVNNDLMDKYFYN